MKVFSFLFNFPLFIIIKLNYVLSHSSTVYCTTFVIRKLASIATPAHIQQDTVLDSKRNFSCYYDSRRYITPLADAAVGVLPLRIYA